LFYGVKIDYHRFYESRKIWAGGLIVGEICEDPSHWNMAKTLSTWMAEQGIPGISGIDTRQLTKHIRNKGTLLGKIVVDPTEGSSGPSVSAKCINGNDLPFKDPNLINLVDEVSIKVCTLLVYTIFKDTFQQH
jgi:carbamoyl-phosphate synthase/aspartate carbamoyltransferase/dihydroorotase